MSKTVSEILDAAADLIEPEAPQVGQWAVVSSRWGWEAISVDAVTPKLVKSRRSGRGFTQYPRGCIVALFNAKEPAKQLMQAIDGARDRFKKLRRKENERHTEAMLSIREKQDAAVQRVIDAALSKHRGEQA